MASTLQQLIDQTKADYLMGGQRDIFSRLSATIDASTEVITLIGNKPAPSSVLTIDTEDILVLAVSGAATTAVKRGYNATTAASHTASTALVLHNARFPDWKILRAMNDELRSLSAPGNLFRVKTVPITSVSGQYGYDIAGAGIDFLDLLNVEIRDLAGSFTTTKRFTRSHLPRVKRDMPTADFASGYALFFDRPLPASHTIYVTYAATYGLVAAANLGTDIGTTTGLQTTAEDLLPIGAAIRLVLPREVKRNFTETRPESRPSVDVPPGAVARSAFTLEALRNRRINEERARLMAQYEVYAHVRSAAAL